MTVAIPPLVALGVAAVAAYTDWRRGTIPNWLTLPPLVIAPVVYFLLAGVPLAAASVVSALLCGAVPYLMFRRDAIGGGDVKLLAAVGAIAGAGVGLEGELFAFTLAAVWALVASAIRGGLGALARNALFLLVNPLLPARMRRAAVPQPMTSLRLGAFVLVGVGASIALRHGVVG
jgi:prepilin peptidase CpaA